MPDFNKSTSIETTLWNVYSADSKNSDLSQAGKENIWHFNDFSKYYGIYINIGQYQQAINAFATWVVGQGYKANAKDKVILEHIKGWGEDSFLSILWQMIVIKKVNGDSFCEVMRDSQTGDLVNLKPLDPSRIKIKYNDKGLITKYIYNQGKEEKDFKPQDILHFCNNRTIDEPHGNSVTKCIEWVVEAIEEAKATIRRMMRLSAVRILYVDENDTTRQEQLKKQLKEGIDKGYVLLLPCKPEEARFEDLTVPPTQAIIIWLQYLEDQFYKQIGVPKVVLGGTSENTEASAKVGVISYEPIWTMEINEIETDLWNQLGVKIKINKQPSLMENMQTDESKNTGQTKLKYQGSQ